MPVKPASNIWECTFSALKHRGTYKSEALTSGCCHTYRSDRYRFDSDITGMGYFHPVPEAVARPPAIPCSRNRLACSSAILACSQDLQPGAHIPSKTSPPSRSSSTYSATAWINSVAESVISGPSSRISVWTLKAAFCASVTQLANQDCMSGL
jgi:hypothetical protein